MDLFPESKSLPTSPCMLVSKDKNRFIPINGPKVRHGQFFTQLDVWFRPHLQKQLQTWNPVSVIDPFAGEGHLLELAKGLLGCEVNGYDIHPNGPWSSNDSLVSIPPLPEDSVVLTNPPYLASYSAKRKGVIDTTHQYFSATKWDDLYQVALDRCQNACPRVMAIIPETFLNSPYPKSKLCSFTVLLENPFEDTETPVGVACFDGLDKSLNQIPLYVGDECLTDLGHIESLRLRPANSHSITFNDAEGQIGLRAVDMPDPSKSIQFFLRDDLDYDPAKIKVSSRLVTYIRVPKLDSRDLSRLVSLANKNLASFRLSCHDLLLSPFKGNTKMGHRRRRLDYATARALLERSMNELRPQQPSLF